MVAQFGLGWGSELDDTKENVLAFHETGCLLKTGLRAYQVF